MTVLLIFLALVFVGDAAAVGIASFVEHFSKSASLFVFLALFIAVFWMAWLGAVAITERYLIGSR
jgi:hypothetical protein